MPHFFTLSWRSIIPALILTSLMLTTSHARAGSYVGTFKTKIASTPATNPITYVDSTTPSPYADGTHYQVTGYTGSDPNDPTKRIFDNAPDTVTNGSYQGGSSGDGINGTQSDCSGAIQTSWTWVPATGQTMTTDPPPSQVIIMQTCTVAASLSRPGGTASYSDGLGTSGSSGFNPPHSTGGSAADTLYSVVAGGATVALPSFGGTAHVTAGNSSASLSYTASISPVTINITGTNNPSIGDYHVLTGQQITAALSGIPNNFTVTHYTWSPPSGTCFKTYDPALANNQLVPLDSSDLSGPAAGNATVTALNFYDRAAENLTVTCTISATAPDGTPLSLSATSPQIIVLKPTLTQWDIAEGYVQYNSNTDNGSAYGLYGNLSGTGNSTNGMIWSNVTVNVPAPFSGNGQCTFTQLLSPNRIAYVNGTSKPQVPFNGILGIDGSFNYGSSWGVTAAGNDADDPNQPLYYVSGLTEFNDSDAFTTYVMYQPSGGVWVPLEKISWMWSVTLDWQSQIGQFALTASYPHTAGQAGTPTHVPTSDPPQWTVIHPSQPH